MHKKSTFIISIISIFVIVCLTLVVGSVSADFPERACEPSPGQIHFCKWTAEGNFDAIRQWLWYDKEVDIWYWQLFDSQSLDDAYIENPTFTNLDYNLMPIQADEPTYTADFALMLHMSTSSNVTSYRECGVGLFFEDRADGLYLSLTNDGKIALWWERTVTNHADFVYDIDDAGLLSNGMNQILLIRQDDVMLLYINGDQAMRYTNVDLPDVTIQVVRGGGEICFFELAWVAVP